MKKHLLVTVALLMVQQLFFCSGNLFAQAPDFLWATMGGGTEEDYGNDIAVDLSGNSYVTGTFKQSATFGSTTLTSSGENDIFIVKYDASGNVIWAKKGGGSDWDNSYGIAIDASGNSYITGFFRGSPTFDNITLTCKGGDDMFVVKYDPSGNVLWAKNEGGINQDGGLSIAVDASGHIYVTGIYSGSATFGNITLSSNPNYNVFVSKFDALGNVLWAKGAGGINAEWASAIAIDGSGNSYVTGRFDGTFTFGNTTLTSNGNTDMFILKYDALGNILWANKGGGTEFDYGRGIAVDASGNSYVTGVFKQSATFGSNMLTSSGGTDLFLVKYDASGNLLWVKKSGGADYDSGFGIVIDGLGNNYVTGGFRGSATFGHITLTSNGNSDLVIVKHDPSGNVLWANKGGGAGSETGYGIAIDASGNCYVIGSFHGTAAFSSSLLTSNGNSDMFITKLSPVVSGLEDEASMANIQIYPNPFTSTFSITLPEQTAEPLHIRMTDVLGREVYRQSLAADAAGVVSVSPSKALPAGLYQLQVRTTKATFIKKLVVE